MMLTLKYCISGAIRCTGRIIESLADMNSDLVYIEQTGGQIKEADLKDLRGKAISVMECINGFKSEIEQFIACIDENLS